MSWIYVIEDEGNGLLKIGFTTRTKDERIRELQTGNGSRLRVIASTRGDKAMETYLHERFAADRGLGEWFKRSPAIDEFVNSITAANAVIINPGVVDSITEMRSQLATVRRGILAGTVEQDACRSIQRCVSAETKLIDTVIKATELKLRYSATDTVSVDILGEGE